MTTQAPSRLRPGEWIVEVHRSVMEAAGKAIEGDTGGQWVTIGVFSTRDAEHKACSIVARMDRIVPGLHQARSVTQVIEERIARTGTTAPAPPPAHREKVEVSLPEPVARHLAGMTGREQRKVVERALRRSLALSEPTGQDEAAVHRPAGYDEALRAKREELTEQARRQRAGRIARHRAEREQRVVAQPSPVAAAPKPPLPDDLLVAWELVREATDDDERRAAYLLLRAAALAAADLGTATMARAWLKEHRA